MSEYAKGERPRNLEAACGGEVLGRVRSFIKNPDISVGEYVKEHISKLGENIVVRQMRRIELGVSE